MGLNQTKTSVAEAVAAVRALLASAPAASALEQQRLYERWLHREEWRLRTEALPLLCGVAPEARAKVRLETAAAVLWQAVETGIAAGRGPPLVNPEAAAEEWRVRPEDLYAWSRAQGIALPEPLEALMGYILSVLKRPGPTAPNTQPAAATVREQVLGAALNVLAKCPDECYDEHGLVSGKRVAARIRAQSLRWFDSVEPPLDPASMEALIDRWLE